MIKMIMNNDNEMKMNENKDKSSNENRNDDKTSNCLLIIITIETKEGGN